MAQNYSDVVIHESIAQVDTAALANTAVTTAKIANDTILEANLNGVKFTGTIDSVTTTLTHSLGSTPTICMHWNNGTNTVTVRRVDLNATNAYFIATAIDGCTIEAYALK